MKILNFDRLTGVPTAHQTDIYCAMAPCTNGQRLAVCLFMMSDLPDRNHHLSDIERTLRRIFPPSLRFGQKPDDYVDFQASAIRFLFNSETAEVRRRRLQIEHRLWTNTGRGYWRNTELGNRTGAHILRRSGIEVAMSPTVLNMMRVPVPKIDRPYMEEHLSRLGQEL